MRALIPVTRYIDTIISYSHRAHLYKSFDSSGASLVRAFGACWSVWYLYTFSPFLGQVLLVWIVTPPCRLDPASNSFCLACQRLGEGDQRALPWSYAVTSLLIALSPSHHDPYCSLFLTVGQYWLAGFSQLYPVIAAFFVAVYHSNGQLLVCSDILPTTWFKSLHQTSITIKHQTLFKTTRRQRIYYIYCSQDMQKLDWI